MGKEIGSFFEINENQKKQVHEQSVLDWIEKVIGHRKRQFLCSGREAIEMAVQDIEKRHAGIRKVCLLPQYTCDTVVLPFNKHQWQICFYPVNLELRIDINILRKAIEEYRPSVLLMHPYYGMGIDEGLKELIHGYMEEGRLIFIADMTQSIALLNESLWADYCVASLRKWFDIPDGAIVISDHQMDVDIAGEKNEYVELKKKASISKYMYLNGCCDVLKEEFLKMNKEAEQYLYQNTDISELSGYSKERLGKIDVKEMFFARQSNSEYLQRRLEASCLKIGIMKGMGGAVPLYFPIYVSDRKGLQNYLIRQGIYTSILWPRMEETLSISDSNVSYIYEHLLAIPCDQRYSVEDMEQIIHYIKKFEEST